MRDVRAFTALLRAKVGATAAMEVGSGQFAKSLGLDKGRALSEYGIDSLTMVQFGN